MPKNSILKPTTQPTDTSLEKTLRPRQLADFIGQTTLKQTLELALTAARNRQEPLDHLLFYGPPGLGKTTLSYIIANELSSKLHITSGPAIARAGDLASILTNLKPHDVLFIDEIHRINKTVEETLYSAMEEYRLDIILGKGPAARNVRIKLKPFTLIGATTKYGALTSPLRSRFGLVQKLTFYNQTEIEQIIRRSAQVLNIKITDEAIKELALRSRGTPRIANRLLKRARDMAEVKFNGIITLTSLHQTFELLQIDNLGLDEADRQVLRTIIQNHQGGPVGLGTIANSLSEDLQTVEEVYEPYLIQAGLLARTHRGRIATPKAYRHLGLAQSS